MPRTTPRKTKSIGAKVEPELKERLEYYVHRRRMAGFKINESDVVRQAVMEFLDREDERQFSLRTERKPSEQPPVRRRRHLTPTH